VVFFLFYTRELAVVVNKMSRELQPVPVPTLELGRIAKGLLLLDGSILWVSSAAANE
jgi:hypothetical protein